jgi:hypothetical protein
LHDVPQAATRCSRPAGEERVGADEKRIGPLRNKRREDLIGILYGPI